MNRGYRFLALVAIAYRCGPAFAVPLYMIQDYGVKGMVRLCKYSDRGLYKVDANSRCPARIADPGYRMDAPTAIGQCMGSSESGGPCSSELGGGLSSGPGGGLSSDRGGGLSTAPGGGLSTGPGGGMNSGPGGGLSTAPGGGLFTGPGGGLSSSPRSGQEGEYKGPWGPCITGAAATEWLRQNCPNRQ